VHLAWRRDARSRGRRHTDPQSSTRAEALAVAVRARRRRNAAECEPSRETLRVHAYSGALSHGAARHAKLRGDGSRVPTGGERWHNLRP
jgi:hypothetical protein